MKRTCLALLGCILVLSGAILGCSGQNAAGADDADTDFVRDVAKGLEARWDLMEADQKDSEYAFVSEENEAYQEKLIKYIDAELEYDEKYKDASFGDSNLEELAVQYVDILEEHKEACAYITTDFEKYYDTYTSVLNERGRILSRLVTIYDLAVNEQYEDYLNGYLTNATIVDEEEGTDEEILALADGIDFELVDEESDENGSVYRTEVINTTNVHFMDFGIQINLLDEKNEIVDSQYAFIENFRKGAKAMLGFTTDQAFVSYEITIDYWG